MKVQFIGRIIEYPVHQKPDRPYFPLKVGAFRRGRLVGIIALTRRSHLCLLFVEKACHRQGIARALFSALRDHCRTAPDTPRITVNSSPYAVGAYRRLGFRTTGDERTVDGIRFTPMEYLFI